MSHLAPRDRLAIQLGTIIIGAALLVRGALVPLIGIYEERAAQSAAAAGRLSRELALVRDGPRLPAELAAARRHLDTIAPHLFAAADTSAANALLASWLRATAVAAGLSGVRTELAPSVAQPAGLLAAQVDLHAEGNGAALADWLHAVEGGERFVAIERLDVTARDNGTLSLDARVLAYALERAR